MTHFTSWATAACRWLNPFSLQSRYRAWWHQKRANKLRAFASFRSFLPWKIWIIVSRCWLTTSAGLPFRPTHEIELARFSLLLPPTSPHSSSHYTSAFSLCLFKSHYFFFPLLNSVCLCRRHQSTEDFTEPAQPSSCRALYNDPAPALQCKWCKWLKWCV